MRLFFPVVIMNSIWTVGIWNVRGCNDPLKIKEINNLVSSNNLCLLSVLGTKVSKANEHRQQNKLLHQR